MDLIYAELVLSNPRNAKLFPITVRTLADTGALHLCIPEHITVQLELDTLDQREVTIADGKKHLCPYVGPIEVHFKNRACFTSSSHFDFLPGMTV